MGVEREFSPFRYPGIIDLTGKAISGKATENWLGGNWLGTVLSFPGTPAIHFVSETLIKSVFSEKVFGYLSARSRVFSSGRARLA